MKIGIVCDAIYPYHKGGKEKRWFEITSKLSRKHEVHVYCMKWWKGEEKIKKNNICLHAISRCVPLYNKKGKRSIWQGIYFGFSCLKLIKEDFDVLDVDQMPIFPVFFSKLVCLLKRKKMIVTWNEVWGLSYWIEYLGIKGILGYSAEKIASLLPDKIISISPFTTKKLINELKVNPEKIETIPPGIDFKEIQKINTKRVRNKIVFVGRLLKHKNADLLIESLARIKSAKLSIVGNGPEKEMLEKLAERLKVNAEFSKFEKHEDVIKEIKSSSVLVLPSSREGFGMVVIEANACGVPVITVNEDDNAAKELIINGKNGFVCRLEEKTLAKKIQSLLKNNFYKKMEKDCISISKNYDLGTLTKKIEEVYLHEQ